MRKVYILGAGFSKEINNEYPVLYDLKNTVYKNLFQYYKNSPILEHFHQLPIEITSDIEMLLSYLSIDWPWKDSVEKHLDLALFKALEERIISIFLNIKNNDIDDIYIKFTNIITNRFYNIISLNYDSLIEEIAIKNNLVKRTEYCGYEIIIEDEYDKEKLLKPDEDIIFDKSSRSIRINRTYLANVSNENIDNVFLKNIGKRWTRTPPNYHKRYADSPSNEKPNIIKLHGSIKNEYADGANEIIPPMLDKSKYYQSGKVQSNWKNALKLLCESDELNIIGFSFPKTDISMVYLVQTALAKNKELKLSIINIESKEKAREKYRELFPNKIDTINFNYCGIDAPLKKYTTEEFLS